MKTITFVDKDEIAEAVGEYYDFSKVTDEQWAQIDEIIKTSLEKRGISYTDMRDNEYDEFCAIADGACSYVGVSGY